MVDVTFLRRTMRGAANLALSTFWPPTCVLCGGRGSAPAQDLCGACEADLPVNSVACAVCAEPLAAAIDGHLRCGLCLKRAPRFDAAVAAYRYAYPIDHLVRALKYQSAIVQARVLGDLLANRVRTGRSEFPGLLIPVPLAPQRFRSRGYNQALELARRLEMQLRIPMRADLIMRTRETVEQVGLGQKERRRNIRNAFAITGPLPAHHIAIVDDVITTGSTANELARVLKRAGAKRVEVWAVARAGSDA